MSRSNFTDNIPPIKPDREEIKASSRHPVDGGYSYSHGISGSKQLVHKAPSSKLSKLISLLLIALISAGGWWFNERLIDMEALLDLSRSELSHSRKRIGELEALVVATDTSVNKSGTAVQAQVNLLGQQTKERNKFVDAELDKLWGVALRTNQAKIEENTKAMENNTVNVQQNMIQIKDLAEQMTVASEIFTGLSELNQSNTQKIAAQKAQLDKLAQMLDSQVVSLNESIDQSNQQIQIDMVSLKAQFESVSTIQQDLQALTNRLTINENDVKAINSFRLTTNKKLLQLENQLRNAQFGNAN